MDNYFVGRWSVEAHISDSAFMEIHTNTGYKTFSWNSHVNDLWINLVVV